MSQEIHRDIGRHDEAIETLKARVDAIGNDVAEIKAMMQQARGGWKTLVAVGSIAGTVGAALMKIFGTFKGVP